MCVIFVGLGDRRVIYPTWERVQRVKGFAIVNSKEIASYSTNVVLLGFSRAPSENERFDSDLYTQPIEDKKGDYLLFHGVLPYLNEPDLEFLHREFLHLLDVTRRDLRETLDRIRLRFPTSGAFIGVSQHRTYTQIVCARSFLPLYVYELLPGSYAICNLTPSELRLVGQDFRFVRELPVYSTTTLGYQVLTSSLNLEALTPKEANDEAVPQYQGVALAFSGGMDCTATALALALMGYRFILPVTFDYGQPEIELSKSKKVWTEVKRWLEGKLGVKCGEWRMIVLKNLPSFSTNRLKEGIGDGEVEMETTARYVPQRNLQFLSILAGYAEAHHPFIEAVALGANLTEGMVYPDNSAAFIHLFDQLLQVSGARPMRALAPLAPFTKSEIVALCRHLEFTPLDLSWSCYTSDEKPCGSCGSCFARQRAFERAAQVPRERVEEMVQMIRRGV